MSDPILRAAQRMSNWHHSVPTGEQVEAVNKLLDQGGLWARTTPTASDLVLACVADSLLGVWEPLDWPRGYETLLDNAACILRKHQE